MTLRVTLFVAGATLGDVGIHPAAPATSQVHMEIPATSRRWKTPRRTWYHYCHGQSVGRPGRSDPTHRM